MATSPETSNDSSYARDNEAEVDEFERKDFAQRIAKTVLKEPLSHSSLIVSIVGAWGSGKSTVLKYIRDELAQEKCKVSNDPYKVANFNPWRYAGEDTLLLHLFTELVHAVDPDLAVIKKWQEMERAAKQRTRLGKLGANLAGLAAHLHTPGSGTLVQGALASILPEEFKIRLDEIKEQVSLHLSRSKLRIIMPIDDVDRLDPQEILLLFRSLKLIADLPNTTFIIAMDEEHVSQVIGKHIDGNPETGRRYIEKIVNVRLTLPAIPDHILETHTLRKLSEVLRKSKRELSQEDGYWVRPLFHRLHAPFIQTPRKVKALQNALTFALGLLPAEEVNTGDVILLEATRILHPDLYQKLQEIFPHIRSVYKQKDHLKTYELGEQQAKERWDILLASFTGLPPHRREGIKNAIGSWLPAINTPEDKDRAELRQKKRICSSAYFWRYFSGTIQKDDVPDMTVIDWVERASQDQPGCNDELKAHLERPYASAFLTKVQIIGEQFPTVSKPILISLVYTLSRLPEMEVDSLVGSTRSNALSILDALMRKVTDPREWDDLMTSLVQASGNLQWSLWLWRDISEPNQSSQEITSPKLLSELTKQCITAYEDGHNPQGEIDVSLRAGVLIQATSQSRWKKKIQALVRKRPDITLHLLTWGCALSSSREGKCWRWQDQAATYVENAIGSLLLKRNLQKLGKPPTDFQKPDGRHTYLTLEEVGWACLETMKKPDEEAKAQKAGAGTSGDNENSDGETSASHQE